MWKNVKKYNMNAEFNQNVGDYFKVFFIHNGIIINHNIIYKCIVKF